MPGLTIKTRYGPGDEVWEIVSEAVYEPCASCEINRVTGCSWHVSPAVRVVEHFTTSGGAPSRVDYFFKDESSPYLSGESDLFPTQAEAQAEADKRNAEEKA